MKIKSISPKKRIKLFVKHPFLPLCFQTASLYSKLLNGNYEVNGFTICKVRIYLENTVRINTCPTRVNIKTGIVEINDNLYDYTFSGLFLVLVWAFVRRDCLSPKDADKKALEILIRFDEFIIVDGIKDFVKMLTNKDSLDNRTRVTRMIKKYLKITKRS